MHEIVRNGIFAKGARIVTLGDLQQQATDGK